jgi:hypothetical protein
MGGHEMMMHSEPETKAVRELNRRIHRAARKASKHDVDLPIICNALENRSTFARYIEQRNAREYPRIVPEPKPTPKLCRLTLAESSPR